MVNIFLHAIDKSNGKVLFMIFWQGKLWLKTMALIQAFHQIVSIYWQFKAGYIKLH